jgi:hypothetical protein
MKTSSWPSGKRTSALRMRAFGGGGHRNERFVLADPEVQRFLHEREFMGTELEQRRAELLVENRTSKLGQTLALVGGS